MNKKERQISDTLIENIEMLMKKKNIKTDATCMRQIKEKTGFDFNQSTFSDIKNGNQFPTMMQLIAFSDFFEVSIDFLLGKEKKKTNMSISEVCKSIAKMFESDINLRIAEVEVPHTYYNDFGMPYPANVEYKAFYFFEDDDREILPFTFVKPFVKPCRKASVINKFIKQIIDIQKVKHTISDDTYNRIITEWINEVEDTEEMMQTEEDEKWKKLSLCDDELPF